MTHCEEGASGRRCRLGLRVKVTSFDSIAGPHSPLCYRGALLKDKLNLPQRDLVSVGPLKTSTMGLGTWSWGNKLLWGYSEDDDAEIQEVFNLVVRKGINLFDSADSYGVPMGSQGT